MTILHDPTGISFIVAVLFAAALEVVANLLLAKSDGFRKRKYAAGALLLVGLAFTALAYAVRGMDLAVAYAMWGAFGILGTSIGGWILFGQRLKATAWLGIAMLISGLGVLHLG